MEFSLLGLVYVLLLLVPNLLWFKNHSISQKKENKVFVLLEKSGQIMVIFCLLFFSNTTFTLHSMWTLWLAFSLFFMILYLIWWIRYFKSEQTEEDLVRPFLGIPLAGAVLPLISFILLGIYANSLPLIISAIIFGIGHIGVHLSS